MDHPALSTIGENVKVWWSSSGRMLHLDPDCPPFFRARLRAIVASADGAEAAVRVFSYDFRQDEPANVTKPPDRLLLCRLCASGTSRQGNSRQRRHGARSRRREPAAT